MDSGSPTSSSDTSTLIVQQNVSFIAEKYISAENLIERVVVFISLPGGASNVHVELNEEGTSCVVTHTWPEASFNMANMFRKKLKDKTITLNDPKILAIERGLSKVRKSIDAAPVSRTIIPLPMKVQTDPSSWTKNGVERRDGTQIILADFKGHCTTYNKKIKDSSVTFDM